MSRYLYIYIYVMTITFATYTNSPPYRTVTVVSPALDSESVRFMNCSGKSFGEIVSIHKISGTLDSDKVEVVSMSGDAMFYDSSIGSFILL